MKAIFWNTYLRPSTGREVSRRRELLTCSSFLLSYNNYLKSAAYGSQSDLSNAFIKSIFRYICKSCIDSHFLFCFN